MKNHSHNSVSRRQTILATLLCGLLSPLPNAWAQTDLAPSSVAGFAFDFTITASSAPSDVGGIVSVELSDSTYSIPETAWTYSESEVTLSCFSPAHPTDRKITTIKL